MFIDNLFRSISLFLNLLCWVIMFRCILSFVITKDNIIMKLLYTVTEPLLKPIRNLLFRMKLFRNSNLDFSPVIVILIISVIDSLFWR